MSDHSGMVTDVGPLWNGHGCRTIVERSRMSDHCGTVTDVRSLWNGHKR